MSGFLVHSMSMILRLRALTFGLTLSLLVGSSVSLVAQSLGDVAKKEEDRRKTIKDKAKVITNKDLVPAPPSAAPPSETPEATDEKSDEPGEPGKASSGAKPEGKGNKSAPAKEKDQNYWAGRMRDLRTQLERDQSYLDALQSKINALTTDFVNRDDPKQREEIGRERQRSLDELERLKQAIPDDKKAISDLEEEARRAGVPPGWLRS